MVCLCTFLYFPNFYSERASLTSIYNEKMFCLEKERKGLISRNSKQREILLRRKHQEKEDSIKKLRMEVVEKTLKSPQEASPKQGKG